MKAYIFKIGVSAELTGYVYATSEEEAKELIEQKKWEEIEETKIEEVEEIKDIEEVKDDDEE